jgi:hypothetical protein
MRYQAESPDEAALVAAGKAFGFFFHKRNHTSVLVREPAPQEGEDAASGAGAQSFILVSELKPTFPQ